MLSANLNYMVMLYETPNLKAKPATPFWVSSHAWLDLAYKHKLNLADGSYLV